MTCEQSPVRRLSRASGKLAFGTDAAGYHAGRMGYPAELYEAIFSRVGSDPRILEVGAGTGLATQALLTRAPSELVVVESDPALVGFLGERFTDARLTLINGEFPDASIDGRFDLVVCAAAFHWLEPHPALARIRQLLRPGGVWAMWWNAYRNPSHDDPLAKAITPLLTDVPLPPSEELHGHYSQDVELHTEALAAAGFSEIEHYRYRHERMLSAVEVRALYESYSYVRALPEARRLKLLNEITEVVTWEFGGWAPNIVVTTAYSALQNEQLQIEF